MQAGYGSALLFLLVSTVWAMWRAMVAIAVVYRVDLVKALLILLAPLVSLILFAGLLAAGQLALLLQML